MSASVLLNRACFTSLRSWPFLCVRDAQQCTSQDDFYRLTSGFQPGCPSVANTTATPSPEAACTLDNDTCAFVEGAPTCVSWLRDCNIEYSCTSEAEYTPVPEDDENICSFPALPPPTPNTICIPVNDTCEWHNPCRVWQNWCGSEYKCGSEAQYAAFIHGPQPLCAYPNPNMPGPVGECVYQDGQCEWSGKPNIRAYHDAFMHKIFLPYIHSLPTHLYRVYCMAK